jgi:hypothetical protein
MNKYIASILALCLSITSYSQCDFAHEFRLGRGPVNVSARINSHGDLFDYFELEFRNVNICFYDMTQVSEFENALMSCLTDSTENKPIVFRNYYLYKQDKGKVLIADINRDEATLNTKHINQILESIKLVNSCIKKEQ